MEAIATRLLGPVVLAALVSACGAAGGLEEVASVQLVDVTKQAGLPVAGGMCLVFRDLDGDLRPDVLLAPVDYNGRTGDTLALHRGTAGGTFNAESIPIGNGQVKGCVAGDVDGDGRADVVVVRSTGDQTSLIVLRLGADGHLAEDPAFRFGPLDPDVDAFGLLDYDGDGRLDVYVSSFSGHGISENIQKCVTTKDDFTCGLTLADAGRPPVLLRNNGSAFEPSGITLPGGRLTNVVRFVDWDGDGWVDVFESNDFGANRIFRNLEGAAFEEILERKGGGVYNHGMGMSIADLDHDGDWDFYGCDLGPDQLWFSRPDGTVENRAWSMGIGEATRLRSCWGSIEADLDHDGFQDLVVPASDVAETTTDLEQRVLLDETASAPPPGPTFTYLFLGRAGGRVAAARVPFPRIMPSSRIVAELADYDLDGDLDAIEVYEGVGLRLLRNDMSAGHYLMVRLVGSLARRDGTGATVTVELGGGQTDRRMINSGGQGGSTELAHFGLGDRTSIASLTVRWPGGKSQRVPGPIQVDRVLEVLEQ